MSKIRVYELAKNLNKDSKEIIEILKSKGVELVNITLGNPYLIPHINRPCINAPEDGSVGMKRIYDVTKELNEAFPNVKFIASGLSFEGENALDYAAKVIDDGVADFAGFGRMTFAYPDFYVDYLKNGKLEKSKVCLKCSKCSELILRRLAFRFPIEYTFASAVCFVD